MQFISPMAFGWLGTSVFERINLLSRFIVERAGIQANEIPQNFLIREIWITWDIWGRSFALVASQMVFFARDPPL